MTRSVWRKRFKIAGLVLSIMMLGLWVFSVMFVSYYVAPSGQWSLAIEFGRIRFADFQASNPGWTCLPFYSNWKEIKVTMPWTEFARAWLGLGLPGKHGGGRFLTPVWLLVVTVGLPTAILWWRDRPPKAGFCMVCKYNLTGNVSCTCPECGTAVE